MADIAHVSAGPQLSQVEYEAAASHKGIMAYTVYPIYSRRDGGLLMSNPSSWTNFVPDVGGGPFHIIIECATVSWTHAKLVVSGEGNEAGASKGFGLNLNGTWVTCEWSGASAVDREGAWTATGLPASGVVQGLLQVYSTTATEDITLYSAQLFLKRDVT
jgi:hypothetical protein